LALAVLLSCVIFLVRRLGGQVKRLKQNELNGWPKTDANLILCAEILLMSAFLVMNAADYKLQELGQNGYHHAGSFPVSSHLINFLPDTASALIVLERFCWWFHIVGVLAFLNY